MPEWEIAAIAVAFVLVIALLARRRRSENEPDDFFDHSEGERFPHKWGYTDTRFEFVDDRKVKVTGTRYPISGYEMPFLVAFVEDVLGITIRREDSYAEREDIEAAEPNVDPAFANALKERLGAGRVSFDPEARLVHSHGQLSVEEVYRVMYGDSLPRLVDLVFYPEEEADVKAMIDLANEHNVCLVPYGGGTNVSGALACPADERRTIVSVDMRRMDRVVWIDEANLQACVEAGISGKAMERALGERGYTSGHDPDSVELSTMGGWISTNASGMKKNRYGNIEDIVLEATLVTPTGEIATRQVTPRNSTGVQPRGLLFGSEGNFGIITTAVIKIHPIPEARKYGFLVFPAFEKGVAYLKALRQTGMLPASIRLVNNNEFRFGQALKAEPTFLKGVKEKIQKFVLQKILGFDPMQTVGSYYRDGGHARRSAPTGTHDLQPGEKIRRQKRGRQQRQARLFADVRHRLYSRLPESVRNPGRDLRDVCPLGPDPPGLRCGIGGTGDAGREAQRAGETLSRIQGDADLSHRRLHLFHHGHLRQRP